MAVPHKTYFALMKLVRNFLLQREYCTEQSSVVCANLRDSLRAFDINSTSTLVRYLKSFPKLFIFSMLDGAPCISLTTYLTVCPTHSKKAGSCRGCSDLHICMFYLLSGICEFGDGCFFGHSLQTPHNMDLFLDNHLGDLTLEDLRVIFTLPYVRQGVTRPQVCRFYNSPGECSKDDGTAYSCKSLHLCRHYVLNDCRYGIECRLNHYVTNDDQVLEILELYGVPVNRRPKDILQELFIYLGEDLENDDIRARIHADWLEWVKSKKTEQKNISPIPTLVRARSVGNLSPKPRQVCSYFLLGRCKFGTACRNLHERSVTLPLPATPSRDAPRPGAARMSSTPSVSGLTDDFARLSTSMSTASNFPSYWTDMKGKELQLVQLSPSTEEWRKVEKAFLKDMPRAKVICIRRVQNRTMWEAFFVQKQSMERKYGNGRSNEKYLFHGTPYHAVEPIAHQNIDPLLAGTNVGAKYGRGAYFAADSAYSDCYTTPSPSNHRYMYYARVLLGYLTKGDQGMQRPPPRSTSDPNSLYDSVADNVTSPRIHVVFRNQQIYPEYLIQYQQGDVFSL